MNLTINKSQVFNYHYVQNGNGEVIAKFNKDKIKFYIPLTMETKKAILSYQNEIFT